MAKYLQFLNLLFSKLIYYPLKPKQEFQIVLFFSLGFISLKIRETQFQVIEKYPQFRDLLFNKLKS